MNSPFLKFIPALVILALLVVACLGVYLKNRRTVRLSCPHCHKPVIVREFDALAGKNTACPHCRQNFQIQPPQPPENKP